MSSAGKEKTRRVISALEHGENDKVPVGEFFWTNFTKKAASFFSDEKDFNPYYYWDLDLLVINPNMDPHIRGVEIIEDLPEKTVVKTGFEATIELRPGCAMPRFLDFKTKTYKDMEEFSFDDPHDERRFQSAIDDQINSVADALNLGLPPFVERLESCCDDFCVFGSICEPFEMFWRIVGMENAFMKIAEEPDKTAKFITRLGDFLVSLTEEQIAQAGGKLSGLYIWGDVAYDRGVFFSPDYWRAVFKPVLMRICNTVHKAGLKTIYHGCGNAKVLFEDMIEAGVDAYNPLEAKAGLNVVDLKKEFGTKWSFNGNIDVRVLSTNNRELVRKEVLTKLNAAKGGGLIFQSDHSIPGTVKPETYDFVIKLLREYGKYPLELGEFDIQI